MVNLLRFVEKEISSTWFVVCKPFGIPTVTASKTAWDLQATDSVMNRIHLMGYAQLVTDMYSRPRLTGESPPPEGPPSMSVKKTNPTAFAPLWNMSSDSRGLLALCRGKKAIDFFLTASKCKLIQRSYIVLTETERLAAGAELPESLEGYTLRSDQFWSPVEQNPRKEERIYMLFISDREKSRRDHPWLSPNQRLAVIPAEKVGQHYGKRFHMRAKLLSGQNKPQTSGGGKVRQMYRVDLIEGNEEAMRCVLAQFGCPIVNDAIYNSAFASEVFQRYTEGQFSKSSAVHNSIERGLLALALRPLESQFLHLGMSCAKITLPDPDDEGNVQQVDRAKILMGAGSSKDSMLFTESLNSITIESQVPPEFTAWVNGEPIPGISAKNATMPIENFPCLATKILDPNSVNRASSEPSEEDTIMVTDGPQTRQIAQYSAKRRILKHRLVQCTPPVDSMKRNPFEQKLPNSPRSGLLCKNCGDFHSEHSCPLVPTAQLDPTEGYEEFYSQSTGRSVRKPFCITCGVFGHAFRTCVHTYPRYVVHQNPSSTVSQFSRKIRQCQICKDSSHIELHCARKKSPPWGYDELGQPVTRNAGMRRRRKAFNS